MIAMNRILVVQSGFLGDVVLSTPVMSELRARYPEAHIAGLTTPLAEPLLRHHPALNEVLVFDKRGVHSGIGGLWQMAGELRRAKFDAVFSLHKSYRTAVLLWLAGIKERFGFAEASAAFLYTKTATRSEYKHEVIRNLALLKNIDLDPETITQRMRVEFSAQERERAGELLERVSEGSLVGLAPGSVWATKRWTPEGFSELADRLSSAGYSVVLIGGPNDAEVGRQIELKTQSSVLNLIGKCSLIESAAVIDRLELLVTNDSAPLHLASARGTPIVAVFCATVPEFGFGPWQVLSEVVGVSGLSCRPCGSHGKQYCPTGTHACQKRLSANQVFAAAERVLNEKQRLTIVH